MNKIKQKGFGTLGEIWIYAWLASIFNTDRTPLTVIAAPQELDHSYPHFDSKGVDILLGVAGPDNTFDILAGVDIKMSDLSLEPVEEVSGIERTLRRDKKSHGEIHLPGFYKTPAIVMPCYQIMLEEWDPITGRQLRVPDYVREVVTRHVDRYGFNHTFPFCNMYEPDLRNRFQLRLLEQMHTAFESARRMYEYCCRVPHSYYQDHLLKTEAVIACIEEYL